MKYTKRRTQLYACIFALISAVLALTSTMSIGGVDILFASLGTAITASTQAIIDMVNGIDQTLPILGIDVESVTEPLQQVASGDIATIIHGAIIGHIVLCAIAILFAFIGIMRVSGNDKAELGLNDKTHASGNPFGYLAAFFAIFDAAIVIVACFAANGIMAQVMAGASESLGEIAGGMSMSVLPGVGAFVALGLGIVSFVMCLVASVRLAGDDDAPSPRTSGGNGVRGGNGGNVSYQPMPQQSGWNGQQQPPQQGYYR